MKKTIAALTLMLAFSISATAQSKQVTAQNKQVVLTSHEKAIKEATEMKSFLSLDESQNTKITTILEQKHQTLEYKDLSDERRKILSEVVDGQIKTALNASQIEKFEKNKDLHNRAIH